MSDTVQVIKLRMLNQSYLFLPCALTGCVMTTGIRTWPLTTPAVFIPWGFKRITIMDVCIVLKDDHADDGRAGEKVHKCMFYLLGHFYNNKL